MNEWIDTKLQRPVHDGETRFSDVVIVGIAGDNRIELGYWDFSTLEWTIVTNLCIQNPMYHYEITHWQFLPDGPEK